MLRDYQQRAIDQIYKWLSENDGNVCAVLPTGAGKSHIVAALCKNAVQSWPDTNILMLTHVKELLEQNAEKMLQHWPNAPLGIYSAGVGRRDVGESITFAGIQSVRNKGELLGHVDLIIIDECHLINHNAEGGYRHLIGELTKINPKLRVIGLTATPWRLGHGRIDQGGAIFNALLEPVTIEELVHKGFLSPLRSKFVDAEMDVSGVNKRGGDFVASQLEKAVNTNEQTAAIISETMARAGHCSSVLVFTAGVDHAEHLAEAFNASGWPAESVTGKTPKAKRAEIIEKFKSKQIRVLTNAEVLTTGFDAPDTDCVIMARPTMSPVLYVQIAGRGMRLKSHTDHCLVLDFAGNVRRHGPITSVEPPKKKGKGGGEAPVKSCPECGEAVHTSIKMCPDCGYIWPVDEPKKVKLHHDDIMGIAPIDVEITEWEWRVHTSQKSGKKMIMVTYYKGFTYDVKEYLTIEHDGFAGAMGVKKLTDIAKGCKAELKGLNSMSEICDAMRKHEAPSSITYTKKGKFAEIIDRRWESGV